MEALISDFEAVLGDVGVDQREALVRVRDLIDTKIASFEAVTMSVDSAEAVGTPIIEGGE